MKKEISIYLAGSMQKGHEQNDSHWTAADMDEMRTLLTGYHINFLNPQERSDDFNDQRSVFGRDMLQVFCSDIVFVDARHLRGLGVGAEMMWAKVNRIPVIILAPKESHYNKSHTTLLGVEVENWIHPFVLSLADAVVEDLKEGANWILELMSNFDIPIKGLEYVEESMEYYKENQFNKDIPMKKLICSSKSLLNKANIPALNP